jgi:hypothetical protein
MFLKLFTPTTTTVSKIGRNNSQDLDVSMEEIDEYDDDMCQDDGDNGNEDDAESGYDHDHGDMNDDSLEEGDDTPDWYVHTYVHTYYLA